MHGQVCQYAAIQANLGLAQPGDQAAVGQAIGARGRVDTRDPQRAELALLLPTVTVRVLASLDDGLLGNVLDATAGAVVTLGAVENLLVSASGNDATLDTGHELCPQVRLLEFTGHATCARPSARPKG